VKERKDHVRYDIDTMHDGSLCKDFRAISVQEAIGKALAYRKALRLEEVQVTVKALCGKLIHKELLR
jgi:hypothetical protein